MSIWYQPPSLTVLNARGLNTAVSALGIEITEIGEDFLKGTMPVDDRTRQPLGLLHGGASVLFAETLGSTAANCCVDHDRAYCVGMDINANHVRSMRSGQVTGIARPVHLGRSSQVWEIHISNERDQMICISRLTMAVIQKP